MDDQFKKKSKFSPYEQYFVYIPHTRKIDDSDLEKLQLHFLERVVLNVNELKHSEAGKFHLVYLLMYILTYPARFPLLKFGKHK